jgi:antirestriction protein ArdC
VAYSSYDHDDLRPADLIKIEHRISFSEEQSDISPFTALSVEQLQSMRGESAAAEQTIFENLRTATAEWEEQAAYTLMLDKAIEYARTPPVKHTSNEWQSEYGRHTVSNAVYRMNYHMSEDTEYDRAAKKNVPVAWHVSWSVYTNTPPGNRFATIAGQERKRYTDKAEAEKYLAGRVKAYAHLFTEISPPLPKEYIKNFSVNGKLLPGYTLQGEEKQQPDRAIAENGGIPVPDAQTEPRKEPEPMNEPLNLHLSDRDGTLYGVLLKLPATAEQFDAALSRIGARGGQKGLDYFITGVESPVAAVMRLSVENVQKAGIDELNFFAAALKSRDDRQIDKLNAAAEMLTDKDDIHRLVELTQNTDVYDFHPDISSHIQLGEHTLDHSGLIQIPEEWQAAIDVNMLGELAAATDKGVFTEYGYIAANGEEWKPLKEIPQEYRISPKPPEPGREARPAPERVDTDAAAVTSAAAPGKAAALTVIPLGLTAENPRDRLKEATAKLEAGIKGIFESEQYKTYLKTLSKFHNYSANNCLLIAMQCPNASYVAGFNDWRDKFKRPVKKGEKGMKIFAPAPFKTKKEVDRLDASGKPVIGKDGKRVKDEKEITVPAFKIATVFDASQTDGEPLPQIGVSELAGSVDRYKEMFAALEKTSPVPAAFEKITSGAKGYYHQTEKRIAVNEGMSELQNLKTLIHEIAHARLHAIDANIPIKDQNLPDRRTREVEAESIAYTVCDHYGLDTSDYSFGYVATWSGEKQLDALKASLDTIRKEANAIISEVDKHFTELQQTAEQAAERPAPEPSPEQAAPQGDTFTIYQLKDGDATKDLRFEPLAAITAAGLAAELVNYNNVYAAPLDNGVTLDKIYFTLNMDKPEDFKGHSLSVSDVVVMSKGGKETAFYVDELGFQELPNFLAPKEPTKTVDLAAVADYMNKIRDTAMNADTGKTQGIAAFNMAIKRLEQANARIPDTQPQLKALIVHAAQSPDIAALRERMNAMRTEFIQHYATAPQIAIDTGSKAAPPAPAASQPTAAPKDPPRGENVAAIEAQVKAGQTINLSDLSDAIKKDKAAQAAQSEPSKTGARQTAAKKGAWAAAQNQKAWDYAQGKGASAPAAPKKPSIRDELKAGKAAQAAQKSTPQKAAARNKNAGLGD